MSKLCPKPIGPQLNPGEQFEFSGLKDGSSSRSPQWKVPPGRYRVLHLNILHHEYIVQGPDDALYRCPVELADACKEA